jgi:hypothetical protein
MTRRIALTIAAGARKCRWCDNYQPGSFVRSRAAWWCMAFNRALRTTQKGHALRLPECIAAEAGAACGKPCCVIGDEGES